MRSGGHHRYRVRNHLIFEESTVKLFASTPALVQGQ